MKVTQKEISKVINNIIKNGNDELFAKTESELEGYWHFEWNPSSTIEWNIYRFYSMLKVYGSFCRKWEEHHSDSCCVVERVRDKYLMPKISNFTEELKQYIISGGKHAANTTSSRTTDTR